MRKILAQQTWIDLFAHLNHTNPAVLVTAIISMVFLVTIKFFVNGNRRIMAFIRLPVSAELLLVIFGSLISYLTHLDDPHITYKSSVQFQWECRMFRLPTSATLA